jgi:hypothetical protein
MRRTTPDLVGSRARIYKNASVALLVLTVLYVLWANYVIFVGGNLPLTPISLGEGSVGFGLFMLVIGDLLAVGLLWFLLDGVLLGLLHSVLAVGGPRNAKRGKPQIRGKRRTAAGAPSTPGAAGVGTPAGAWPAQPQGSGAWQPQQGQGAWQPQGQGAWQPQQGQGAWQPQPQPEQGGWPQQEQGAWPQQPGWQGPPSSAPGSPSAASGADRP